MNITDPLAKYLFSLVADLLYTYIIFGKKISERVFVMQSNSREGRPRTKRCEARELESGVSEEL